jgi:hypothetical protein
MHFNSPLPSSAICKSLPEMARNYWTLLILHNDIVDFASLLNIFFLISKANLLSQFNQSQFRLRIVFLRFLQLFLLPHKQKQTLHRE